MHENPTCLGVWKEVFYIKKNVNIGVQGVQTR